MKHIFTLVFFLLFHQAQAQISLLMNGTRAATSLAMLAAQQKKKNKAHAAAAKAADQAATAGTTASPKPVPFKRTEEAAIKGKGGPEIMALEALLEESHRAMQADSTSSFLSAAQIDAIVAADRKAVATRPNWNYAPYRQELALYKKEEARRQAAAAQPALAK